MKMMMKKMAKMVEVKVVWISVLMKLQLTLTVTKLLKEKDEGPTTQVTCFFPYFFPKIPNHKISIVLDYPKPELS